MDRREQDLEEWAIRLDDVLRRMAKQELPDGATGDIAWLIVRCANTSQLEGDWRLSSLEQLVRDVVAFDTEFPGVLPREVVDVAEVARNGSA